MRSVGCASTRPSGERREIANVRKAQWPERVCALFRALYMNIYIICVHTTTTTTTTTNDNNNNDDNNDNNDHKRCDMCIRFDDARLPC